jgi:hypothetical protein
VVINASDYPPPGRWLGGVAGDELDGEEGFGGDGFVVDAVDEQVDRFLGHLVPRDADGDQVEDGEFIVEEPVEADDGEVVGDAEAAVEAGAKEDVGGAVVPAADGGGTVGKRQHIVERGFGVFVVDADQSPIGFVDAFLG